MAFDEALAERIRQRLARRKNVEEKKMQSAGRGAKGLAARSGWREAEQRGVEGSPRQRIQNQRAVDEGLDSSRSRRCRRRRPVERLVAAGGQVRQEAACEVGQQPRPFVDGPGTMPPRRILR